ncbi:hypothetical protein JV173_00480 [Acholeplasma equirhinis]|uniref:lipopolysaccharide biosynthesis protein n=1 Tax=Acholeplasma equirhinis TaxID=555393 RepID=UPI00197AC315|nr:hypothetical protein [Acholeplasma equirhinis]MBN3489979.1 hypothetical protein [Acholeplasma equirhinis]
MSIVGFLAVAELGIGTAIAFSLYKPIVQNDKDQISALYYLFKKLYTYISGIVLVLGLIIIPFLPTLAKDQTNTFNLYTTFGLYFISTILTYFYAFKTSFIDAHKDKYITITIRSVAQILEALLQIILLTLFKSFELFFLVAVISNILQWVITNIIFKRFYSNSINGNKNLDIEIKNEVIRNTKSMFMHKLGGILVVTLNNIVISAFVSVIALGYFSNYQTIINGINSLLVLIFVSLTPIIGHSFINVSIKISHEQFKMIYILNVFVSFLIYLGFLAIADNLISIIFDSSLILDKTIVIAFSINYFVQFLRQTVLVYKDATGNFYYDRFKPIIEGIINIILSIVLVILFGPIGVLVSTIITNIFICHIVEPYVLYKHSFNLKPFKYIVSNYAVIFIYIITVFVFELLPLPTNNNVYLDLILKGFTSVFVTVTVFLVMSLFSKELRNFMKFSFKRIFNIVKKNKS